MTVDAAIVIEPQRLGFDVESEHAVCALRRVEDAVLS
jgi:hypothetical protein